MARRCVITAVMLVAAAVMWATAAAAQQAPFARPCNTCATVPVPTAAPSPTATVPSNR